MRKIPNVLFLFCVCALLETEAKCPDRAIPLCLCKEKPDNNEPLKPGLMAWKVLCKDSRLSNQDQVDTIFRLLREANGLSPADKLTINYLSFRFETGFTLNLSPFFNSTIQILEVFQSPGLTLVGPEIKPNETHFSGLIDVKHLNLPQNGLTVGRLGVALRYFSSNMSLLYLWDNKLAPWSGAVLPGLSALYQLTILSLEGNEFRRIPENYFYFEPAPPESAIKLQNISLKIGLARNSLNSQYFSSKSGLERMERPVILNLSWNLFNTLSAAVFHPILSATSHTIIKVDNNMELTCDSRMAWLKQLSQLGARIEGVKCANDLGNTVLNSTTIDQPYAYGNRAACPDPALIVPCKCATLRDDAKTVGCFEKSGTFAAASKFLQIMRNASGLNIDDVLPIEVFGVRTSTRALNLSLLTRLRVHRLELRAFDANSDEARLVGPLPGEEGLIDAKELYIPADGFTDEGLGNVLSFFSPNMTKLNLGGNNLAGPPRSKRLAKRDDREFLPGLSSLKYLEKLYLEKNQIEELAGGPFKRNILLQYLTFKRNTRLRSIGPRAFLFDPPPAHLSNVVLDINLESCALTDTSFSVDSGLAVFTRPVVINLIYNKLRSLPEEIFGPFLRAHPKNGLQLYKNPFECDDRLAWLQNGRKEFEQQVFDAECSNDPGVSIFLSKFVQKGAPTKCPVSGIFPCTCKSSLEIPGDVDCSPRALTQDHINEALKAIQQVNSQSLDTRPVGLSKFRIHSPLLRLLNLDPFLGFRIESLVIEGNSVLEQISGPIHQPIRSQLFMAVDHLAITGNTNLTDAGLGQALQFFANNMTTLDLTGNALKTEQEGQILTDLARFPNLLMLSLADNKIQTLHPNQFHNNQRLNILNLTGNLITDIPADSFLPKGPMPIEMSNRTLNIILESNRLTPNSISVDSGLEQVGRPVHLNLRNNNLTTLPQVPFASFLKAHLGNSVDLKGNPLVCDEQVEWLTEKKDTFLDVVQNADCANHPGLTIFNFKSPNILGAVLGVAVPSFVIVCVIVLAFGYKYKQFKADLRDLTPEEILEFQKGNPVLDPNDPHSAIYARPYLADWEVPAENIEIDKSKVLGSGQFGIVYSGCLLARSDEPEEKKLVAVKTVRPTVNVEAFKTLLAEIKIMCHLGKHPNVISLIGVSTQKILKRQALVIVEVCANGDLRKFLIKHQKGFLNYFRPNSQFSADKEAECTFDNTDVHSENTRVLSTADLLRFSLGVVNGMRHLTKKNVIQPDLACRNVLLTSDLQIKISDFGLSRQLKNCPNYIQKSRTALPFRWMSIEALKDRNFSIKSDVWSFGVTLWEIFSLGELPYMDSATMDSNFISKLKNGHRLQKPEFSDNRLYDLMMNCWKAEPADRPTFDQIHSTLLDLPTEFLSQAKGYSSYVSTVEV